MGLEKIISFINKNLSYNIINEISLNNNCNKILAENIFFDFNFIIYLNLNELENEINDIIKIIHSLTFTKINKLIEKLEIILDKDHWKIFKDDLINILDGDNKIQIIKELKNFLSSKKIFKQKIINILGKNFNKNLTTIDLLTFLKIYYFIKQKLNSIHYIEFVNNIFLFFDGIPSYSKILEQRRRRTKNYLESNIRKKNFRKNFDNMINDIYTKNGLSYNYFEWLNDKYSIDKSFGPSSDIILNLETFLKKFYKKNNLEDINYNLHICSGKVFGESDYKIFKYISQKNIKNNIYIHTCDSDFLHLILVQQCYYNIFQKKIKFNLIRYYSKNLQIVQHISAEKIIKDILKIINKIYQNDDNNYLLVLDFLLLCYFFGNDHLPSCDWFGPELTLDEIIIILKKSNNDKNIISYESKNEIKINWDILLNFLIEFRNSNKIFKIKFIRNFKIPDILTTFICNNKINYDNFCDVFIPNYLSYLGSLENYNKNDWRFRSYENIKNTVNPFLDYDLEEKKRLLLEKNLKNWLNFTADISADKKSYLPYFNKGIILSNQNKYQDLYIYVSQLSIKESCKNYNIIYKKPIKKNTIDKNIVVKEYLFFFNYLIKNFFCDINNYNPCNFIYFKYLFVPCIDDIINYLKNLDLKNFSDEFKNFQKEKSSIKTKYFDNLSHHLFITPYLLESDFFNQVKQYPNLEIILKELSKIDNLWINLENANNFNFRKLDPNEFLDNWYKIIKRFNVNVNKEVKF